jgi:hypothetical protein
MFLSNFMKMLQFIKKDIVVIIYTNVIKLQP